MHNQVKQYGVYLMSMFMWLTTFLPIHAQGLLFYGNEKRINERSCYTVFTDAHRPEFTDELHISFNYLVNRIESSGYILSLEDKNSGKVYSFTYVHNPYNACLFSFNEEGVKTYHTFQLSTDELAHTWIPVRISLYLKKNQAEFSFGNQRHLITDIELTNNKFSPGIYFGLYGHLLDMASFSIQNFTVADSKRKWAFPLNESEGEDVHDSEGNILGSVVNPVWLINKAYHWKELFELNSDTPMGLAFDTIGQQVLMFKKDSLYRYDIIKEEILAHKYKNESPVQITLGMNFLDTDANELYAYEINNVPDGEPTFAALNLESLDWRTTGRDDIDRHRHHHTSFFNPHEKTLIVFGGYGNRSYYNNFLNYNIKEDHWDTLTVSGDRIEPRYFMGMGVTPDYQRLYIYGGMGNESGNQDVGRNYYYDLYQVDMETKNIRKLWTQEAPGVNKVVARNMIITPDEDYIYMLRYPEYLQESYIQLYKVKIADGSAEVVGDSIPLISEEIATNANLFYSSKLNRFFCSIQEFTDQGTTSARVFSISAPPVSLTAVKYYNSLSPKNSLNAKWLFLLGALVIIFIIILLFRHKKKPIDTTDIPKEDGINDVTQQTPIATETVAAIDIFPVRKNAIFLFGNFTIFDRDGRDITYMFSPKLRTVFLYILLKTTSREGVLSSDMNSLFWGDKPDDKVKNLKGVTMNHIRKILQELDGIELAFQKGYFKLIFNDEFYCDYLSYGVITGGKEIKETMTPELMSLLSKGKFLNSIEHELFDYYKHKVEEFINNVIPTQIEKAFRERKYESGIRLCNILFTTDLLSEVALKYYICISQKMNMSDKALKRYNTFAKEYKREMGEDYPVSYESIKADSRI